MKDRRQVSSIIVDRKALLRFSIPFFVLVVANAATLVIVDLQTEQAVEQIDIADVALMTRVMGLHQKLITTISFGLILTAIACFALWVVYSHRIFGPMVQIRRHIKKLEKGEYEGQIKLRRRDEFKDLADDINQLTTSLRGGGSSKSL